MFLMANKNSGTVPETEADKALASTAQARLNDYRTRWIPVQQRLAQTVEAMGAPNSAERQRAVGASNIDTNLQFGKAAEGIASQQANTGINTGSSRFKLAQANLGSDEARSRGIGAEVGQQSIDDAYVQGLTALMGIGRGQSGMAMGGMGKSAQISGQVAAADAANAASARAGQGEAIGTGLGLGFGAMQKGWGNPQPTGPGSPGMIRTNPGIE
jgi:hypothetical protein